MPFPTPAYPFDASRFAPPASPSASPPSTPPNPPVVLGGVLRPDSPFLDALPTAGEPPLAERVPEISPRAAAQVAARRMILDPVPDPKPAKSGVGAAEPAGGREDESVIDADPFDVVPIASDEWPAFTPLPTVPLEPDEPAPEPEPPAGPFDRAAVERACGRAARRSERVEAVVASDDGVAEHVCDVAAWLAGATLGELRALADDGWSGDEAAELAATLADDDPEVAEVVRHARRTDSGLVVEIDGRAAMAWLAQHRPALAEALEHGTPGAPDEPADDGADDH